MKLLLLWTLLAEEIPDEPFKYVGLAPREIIVFDQSESPTFDQILETLVLRLTQNCSEEIILRELFELVGSEIFNRSLSIDPLVRVGEEIPLEQFLHEQRGICRHYALTTSLLIHRLISMGYLSGKVLLIRDTTPRGRHGWTLFLSESGAWHLDPYWGILKNAFDEKDYLALCQKYGKQTMERQKRRWTDTPS